MNALIYGAYRFILILVEGLWMRLQGAREIYVGGPMDVFEINWYGALGYTVYLVRED